VPLPNGTFKLGKLPARWDPRTFKLGDYIAALPTAPPLVDWTGRVPDYGMLCNDRLGCCVIAGMMHLAMQQRAAAGLAVAVPSDGDVIAAYSAIGGYVPGDPTTDCGCNMLDALNYWRRQGLTFGGIKHQITAFAAVKLHDPAELASALWLFGGTLDGYALPASVQGQPAWKLLTANCAAERLPEAGAATASRILTTGAEAWKSFPGAERSRWTTGFGTLTATSPTWSSLRSGSKRTGTLRAASSGTHFWRISRRCKAS
jgi:hypothetical protein